MRSNFYFGGQCSLDYGVCVEKCPSFATGSRGVEKISVPGRNGDLLIDTGAYSNVTQAYEVWFKRRGKNTTQAARDLALWLLSGRGYLRLEDSYDPDIYRMAAFAGPLDVENWMLTHGRATLEFDCKPQRFFKSGEYSLSVVSGQKLLNQWMPALPLIQISGTGDGQLVVGSSTITITGLEGGITIDSDTQNAYDDARNLNNSISVVGGFPTLSTGKTAVSFSGGITAVQITPRWWTI